MSPKYRRRRKAHCQNIAGGERRVAKISQDAKGALPKISQEAKGVSPKYRRKPEVGQKAALPAGAEKTT